MLFESQWITYETGPRKTADDTYGNPSPYFRKTFTANNNIKKATLFASALGVFKIYMNGSEISPDYLSPGWVDYSKKLPLVRYDITKFVSENNAIGVILGDGWAIGHLGSNYAFKRNGYSDRIEFTAIIRLEYSDGTTEEITTDKTWKASDGSIRRSDIYMGEYVDSRLSKGDFSLAQYDDSSWDNATETIFKFSRNLFFEEVKIPPVVVKATFKPILLKKDSNKYLYDVSQNIAGVLKITFNGESGASAVIKHGELIENGMLYTENLRKAEATDTYILCGTKNECFRPLFTYHGFRYAEIEITGNAEITDIVAEAMYTDLESSGSFECSNSIVNRIYQNALWGQRDNFLGLPTDCPQRDERLGWTGDAQIFCQSAMYNMNCKTFYEKYLADIRDAQLGNGVIPAVAPVPPVGYYSYTGRDAAAGWCEAIGEIPYCHYRMYGDKHVIRDNLPALKRLLDYYETESPDGIRSGKGAYGDWLSLSTPTDLSVISTLYYARAAFLAYKLCSFIHDYEEQYYLDLYKKISAAFRKNFINDTGRIESDTQSAYVIAYSFGIISGSEAKTNLARKFIEDDHKLTTGFLGIRFLLPALCDLGMADIAYKLITNTDYPGWGYSIINGATTIWEHWDSYTKDKGIKAGMNSFNHYSLGSCTEWMYEYCLGINPDTESPGCKKIIFKPYFDPQNTITYAKGHYDSFGKRINVQWVNHGNHIEYRVDIPPEIKSAFEFPGMIIQNHTKKDNSYIFNLIPDKIQ